MRPDILVVDINPQVIKACAEFGFKTAETDVMNVPGVAVSPANSFGYMDGGIDLAYARAYPTLEGMVQAHIDRKFRGELPVGDASLLLTPFTPHLAFIIAPTMRCPGTDLRGTVNAYLATRAAVSCYMERLDLFESPAPPLVIPGMGTASGRLDPYVAARQMAEGVDAALHGVRRRDHWTDQKKYELGMMGRVYR